MDKVVVENYYDGMICLMMIIVILFIFVLLFVVVVVYEFCMFGGID